MKYLDEFRNAKAVRLYADRIRACVTQPWTLMEICGGQTHAIVKYALDTLLPNELRLVHGPGCPVCVTPIATIDRALDIASRPQVIFCSFGDMLRVPGSRHSLLDAKASGADVRIVYSPLDALAIAEANPQREVVFFAIGFETTAPTCAMAARQAKGRGINNFSLLVSLVRVPPAIEALLNAPDNTIDGFLAAGHVCAVMGVSEYEPITEHHHIPLVVAGFEPLDLMQAILACVEQLESGRHQVENLYRRVVRDEGNPVAQAILREVFRVVAREWRGLGVIPASGLDLAPAYAKFDAEQRFPPPSFAPIDEHRCISGEILRGTRQAQDCPHFGKRCTPEHPLGAPMVSSEGICAAYSRYRHAPTAV